MEARERGKNHGADAADRGELRLVAGEIHAFAGDVACGARSVCAVVRRKIDLPRNTAGELVPDLLDGAERLGSGARRAARTFVAYQVSGCGDGSIRGSGDDAAGDDARGYRGGRASRG